MIIEISSLILKFSFPIEANPWMPRCLCECVRRGDDISTIELLLYRTVFREKYHSRLDFNLLDTRYSDSANTSAMGIYLTADGRFRLSLLKCNLHSSLEYSSI